MTLLDTLARKWRPLAVPHLTLLLVIGQVTVYLLWKTGVLPLQAMYLLPQRVLTGEVWRLFTFIFIPPVTNPIFAFFAWYLFYLMGSALEGRWGESHFNIYLLIAYLATLAVSFLTPTAEATNVFIGGSVFLAFAFLYPDFELFLFFILPVKIKWLALVTWIGYALNFIVGSWSTRLMVAASVANFFVFFGWDVALLVKGGRRRMRQQARRIASQKQNRHECVICGITEKADPHMVFRYCTTCRPTSCYCSQHLKDHEHRRQVEPQG